MKKIVTIAAMAAAVAFGFSASAQVLYKVEKKGNDKVSYILGTHHFAPLGVVDQITILPEVIKGAEKVYGEIDMLNMGDPQELMVMQQKHLMAPADSTMAKLLLPEQVDSITTAWSTYVGDASQLPIVMQTMKPAVLSTAIAAGMAAKIFPELNPLEGIDRTMQMRAAEAGKPVAGLETMEYQMQMLYDRPISEQIESLMKTVRDIDEESKDALALSEAYVAHDISKILDLMIKAEDNNEDTMERMLYNRNADWISTLSKEMPESSLFVVVGAGHLPGDRGVLEGLKKAGFTVTPVE